jgi:transmembrane sensor
VPRARDQQPDLRRLEAKYGGLLDRARIFGANDYEPALPPLIGRRKVIGGGVAAAAAILAAGLGWRLWPRGERLITATGEIRHLPLADGSTAVVNSGSAVRIAFSRDQRDVELSRGEAWFHVAKNRARPFTSSPARCESRRSAPHSMSAAAPARSRSW